MHPNGSHLGQIKALVEDDKIKPVIDKVYPFNESIEAFTHLASGRAKGKIVIKIA
jgi:NADPH:quinone reductase-like Zn-dependent oxidoreductase